MKVNGPGRYKLEQGRIPGSGYVERCYCLALLLEKWDLRKDLKVDKAKEYLGIVREFFQFHNNGTEKRKLCAQKWRSLLRKLKKKWQCSRRLNMAKVWRCWTWLGLRVRGYEFESYFLCAYWECREGFQLNQNSLDWSSSRPWVLVLLLTSTQLGGCSSQQ